MTLETIRAFFAWCTVMNWALLMFWFLMFLLARNWVYRIHTKWYRLTREQFDAIHYTLMAAFKLITILFNLVPYLALRIVG